MCKASHQNEQPQLQYFTSVSPNQWQHVIPLSRIFAPKILSVPELSLLGPCTHLDGGHSDEKHRAPAPADKSDTDPGNCLKHVVGRCHPVEAESLRYASFPSVGRSQITKRHVVRKVSQFTDRKQRQSSVGNVRIAVLCSRCGRYVYPVSHVQTREYPVICTVLKNVEGWHCG